MDGTVRYFEIKKNLNYDDALNHLPHLHCGEVMQTSPGTE